MDFFKSFFCLFLPLLYILFAEYLYTAVGKSWLLGNSDAFLARARCSRSPIQLLATLNGAWPGFINLCITPTAPVHHAHGPSTPRPRPQYTTPMSYNMLLLLETKVRRAANYLPNQTYSASVNLFLPCVYLPGINGPAQSTPSSSNVQKTTDLIVDWLIHVCGSYCIAEW